MWRIIRGQKYPVTVLMEGERQVCELSGVGNPEDLERIEACLNACDGIATIDLSEPLTIACEGLIKYGRCGA